MVRSQRDARDDERQELRSARDIPTFYAILSVWIDLYRHKTHFCRYMRKLTPALQTLFAELAQQLDAAPRYGTLYLKRRGDKTYQNAKVPVGSSRVDIFLGKVGDPRTDAEAEALRRGMNLARGRRRLVSMLKKEGLGAPNRVLGSTLDAVAQAGLFKAGAVLVGTAAYMMSEPLVGHFLPRPTLMTGDMDLATADLALKAEPPERFDAILRRGDPSFAPVMQLNPRELPSRFINAEGFQVDLITPIRRKGDSNPMPMAALEAGAAPLQHIDWLIEAPVTAVALWGAGILVPVPQPARFAIHKLILAQKRNAGTRAKRQKDLAQADALIEALLVDDPFALEDALDEARAKGKKGWAEPLDRSLAELKRQPDGRKQDAA